MKNNENLLAVAWWDILNSPDIFFFFFFFGGGGGGRKKQHKTMLQCPLGICKSDLEMLAVKSEHLFYELRTRESDYKSLPVDQRNPIVIERMESLARTLWNLSRKSRVTKDNLELFLNQLTDDNHAHNNYTSDQIETSWRFMQERRALWSMWQLNEDKYMFLDTG